MRNAGRRCDSLLPRAPTAEEWEWLRHGFFLSTTSRRWLKESRNFEKQSRKNGLAAVVAWWHQGLSASHDPDQHTLQARSASRIEDGLVEHRRSNRVTESDQDSMGIRDVAKSLDIASDQRRLL